MNYENMIVQKDAKIAIITLNRPNKRNALSIGLLEETLDALEILGKDTTIRVIVLKGNGPVFCSGHDLSEMAGRKHADYRELFSVCTDMMEAISRIPQPVIAMVHGMAMAAGCQLVAACDLALASEDATFAIPGVKIGLYCTTPTSIIMQNVSKKKILKMGMTGESISAREAERIGLVSEVVPPHKLEPSTMKLAKKIAGVSRHVVASGKHAYYAMLNMDTHQAIKYAAKIMADDCLHKDAREGFSAFIEKREPRWNE